MNTLSWLIYIIDIIQNLRNIGSVALFVLAISIVILVICSIAFYIDKDPEVVKILGYLRKLIYITIALAAIGLFIPSRQTVILIASSEIGERVLKSTTVQSIIEPSIDLLNAWIRKELENIAKSEKK
jgi:hypothetical protein